MRALLQSTALMEVRRERTAPRDFEVVDDAMAQIYAAMTGADRLAMTSGMFRSARDMLLAHLRAEHPDWGQDRVRREAARRLSCGAV